MKFNHKSNQMGTHVEVGRGTRNTYGGRNGDSCRAEGVREGPWEWICLHGAGEVAQLLRAMVALPEDLVLLPIPIGFLMTV